MCDRPQGRKGDKRGLKARQIEWNKHIDDYIASGVDPRPAAEIERGAKVGLSLGALYTRCENERCGKLQGRDVDTMRVCSGCKMVSSLPGNLAASCTNASRRAYSAAANARS